MSELITLGDTVGLCNEENSIYLVIGVDPAINRCLLVKDGDHTLSMIEKPLSDTYKPSCVFSFLDSVSPQSLAEYGSKIQTLEKSGFVMLLIEEIEFIPVIPF